MKVILLNGSPHVKGCTARALEEVAKTLNENGVETEIIQVGKENIRGCLACGYCHQNGKCVIDDLVNGVSILNGGYRILTKDEVRLLFMEAFKR